MSAGSSFQSAATENDLEPKTVRECGTSKWPHYADHRCVLPGRCDTGTTMSLKYLKYLNLYLKYLNILKYLNT